MHLNHLYMTKGGNIDDHGSCISGDDTYKLWNQSFFFFFLNHENLQT